MLQTAPAPATTPGADLDARIDACPKLSSLHSINAALQQLVRSEQSPTSQIADIIRRDPSLTARLLRLVNSVYFGLETKVTNIEDAVFFLGSRHLRQLATATPVIEELSRVNSQWPDVPWAQHWRHSIGVGHMTREILATTGFTVDDETDYIVGLLHNVGRIVIAHVFPQEFRSLLEPGAGTESAVLERERTLLGADHAEIGARYLARHRMSDAIVTAVRHHHDPLVAPRHAELAAALQIADRLVRFAGYPNGLDPGPPTGDRTWRQLPAWELLFGRQGGIAEAELLNALKRLPALLQGLT